MIEIVSYYIHYEVNSKPGNACEYLPHDSFYVRGSFLTLVRGLSSTVLMHFFYLVEETTSIIVHETEAKWLKC